MFSSYCLQVSFANSGQQIHEQRPIKVPGRAQKEHLKLNVPELFTNQSYSIRSVSPQTPMILLWLSWLKSSLPSWQVQDWSIGGCYLVAIFWQLQSNHTGDECCGRMVEIASEKAKIVALSSRRTWTYLALFVANGSPAQHESLEATPVLLWA